MGGKGKTQGSGQGANSKGETQTVGDKGNSNVAGKSDTDTTTDLKHSIDELEQCFNEERERSQSEIAELKAEKELLKALLVKQSNDIAYLKAAMTDMQTRSMSQNVLFHNVAEKVGEDCANVVKELLDSKKYAGEVTFQNIHRLGQPTKDMTRPRPIVARLATYQQVSGLLKFGGTLNRDEAGTKDLRITPQYPMEVRERRRELGEIANQAKTADPNTRTRIAGNRLYVNGQLHRDKLPCPTVKELLYINDTDRAEAISVKFTECSKQVDGCTFTARVAEANSIHDVRHLYRAIMLNPNNLSATHNIAAYRLYKPDGAKTEEGYNDDGDYGFGRLIKDKLQKLGAKNVAVFVTRFYGGEHLGPKRFPAVDKLVEEVMSQYDKRDQ